MAATRWVNRRSQGPVFLKLGEWQRATFDGFDKDSIPLIIGNFRAAVRYDPNWYKAWHKWALVNFDVIEYHEQVCRARGRRSRR